MDAFNLIHATCTKIGIGTEKYRRYINIYHYHYFYFIIIIIIIIKISLFFVTAFAHSQMCLQLPFQSSRFCLLFPIPQEQDFHYKEACRLKPHTLVDYLGFLVPVVDYPKKDEKQKQTNKQTT